MAFSEYGESPIIAKAIAGIGGLSAFAGPTPLNPDTVFRGAQSGCLEGPYLSQFLWKPTPYASGFRDQKHRVPVAGSDFMFRYDEWLVIQNGIPPWLEATFDETPRYIRNGRDLAEYVHFDFTFLNAALILLDERPETLLNRNPIYDFKSPYRPSVVQGGFVTFGSAQVFDWLARAAVPALKAAWNQKWLVHRRLRPEEFGGRLERV